MNFKKLDKLEFETTSSKDINKVDEMTNSELEKFLNIYSLYRKFFTEYIIEKLGLKMYDARIENSGLNIKSIDEKEMDIYQYFSSDTLKYFYIRNNIYIERLNDDERGFLQDRVNNEKYELDELAKDFVEKTYKRVAVEEEENVFEETMFFYGPSTMRFVAPSNALIIGMRYDEFAEDGLTDEEWEKQHDEQVLFIHPMIDMMSYQFQKLIDMPVSIIKYNEHSVIKMTHIKADKDRKNSRERSKDMEEI